MKSSNKNRANHKRNHPPFDPYLLGGYITAAIVLLILTVVFKDGVTLETLPWQIMVVISLAIVLWMGYFAVRGIVLGRKWRDLEKDKATNYYQQRIERLAAKLADTSSEFVEVLEGIALIVSERTESLEALEVKLQELSEHETEMQSRLELLEGIPLPAMDYFMQATESGEKRSARRDYVLFILGMIVSILIAIVLKVIFGI